MKVAQMININGNAWANQFIIEDNNGVCHLQSYKSLVVSLSLEDKKITLHKDWDYSKTTLRAVDKFIKDYIGGDWCKKEIEKAISKGEWTDRFGFTWKFEESDK